jgi:Glycosyl hydrolase family 26
MSARPSRFIRTEPNPRGASRLRRKEITLRGAIFALALLIEANPVMAANGDGLGVYYWGDPRSTDVFGRWVGNTITVAGDFLGASGWSAFTTLGGAGASMQAWATWENARPGRRIVTVGIPPFAWGVGATYAACATGDYNRFYKQLANNVVSSGLKRVDLRVAWEFNGDWTASAEYYPNGDYKNFVNCWRQIVKTMRAAQPKSGITFDWNPAAGCCNYLDERYWPGDEYVDYVGVDLYDTRFHDATKSALSDIAAFARKHGKKITFPEWGLWPPGKDGGQGDDPAYIQIMHDFFVNPSNNVAWAVYFDQATDADHALDGDTRFPKSAALFKRLFAAPHQMPASIWPR